MTSSNWFVRQTRWLGAGYNPLARRGDRVEAWLVVFAMILALLAVPVALTVGSDVRASALATAQAQQASRTPAAATLLAAATPMPATEAQAATSTPTKAVWRLPDGSERTGLVSADGGTPAGAHVPIWLDRAGDPTTPPMTPGDATSLGVGATAAVWAGVVGMLCLLLWLVRLALDGRRDAAWTREWAQLGGDLNRS